MAYPSVTYTFTNGTTASATEVNQNFTDLINGLSDGTKDLSISALTVAGTASLNGAVNIGNATSDDIAVNGYITTALIPKTDDSVDLGTAALAWQDAYFEGVVYTDTIQALNGSGLSFKENGGTEVMSISDAGAVTAGPANGTGTHIVNGNILRLRAENEAATDGSGRLQVLTTNTQAADVGGNIGLGGNTNTTTAPYTFATIAGRKENSTNANYAGYLQFATTNAAGTVSETGRCSSDGAWTLGPSGGGDLSHRVRSGGDDTYLYITSTGTSTGASSLKLENGNGLQWTITLDTATSRLYVIDNDNDNGVYIVQDGTSWTANSDRRVKKNIAPLPIGLAEILALKPSSFDYVSDESESSARIGFIAQEVLPLVPQAVVVPEDTEKMLGVSSTELIPVLVKAIQEQQALIEALQAKVAALEAR
jgi:hypothetical protein